MGKDMFFYKGGTQRGIFVRAADGKVTEAVNRSEDGQELKAKKIKRIEAAIIGREKETVQKSKQFIRRTI